MSDWNGVAPEVCVLRIWEPGEIRYQETIFGRDAMVSRLAAYLENCIDPVLVEMDGEAVSPAGLSRLFAAAALELVRKREGSPPFAS